MYKGYRKKVIVVKDTGSRLFDSAYFVINENADGESVKDMVKEASRIIGEKDTFSRYAAASRFFSFSLGAVLTSLIFAATAIILS